MDSKRKLKQAVYELYKSPQRGDLLIDSPKTKSWRELMRYAEDKEFWKARVRGMRQQPVIKVSMGAHVEEGSWAPFTVSS